jgi:hypothetical protein
MRKEQKLMGDKCLAEFSALSWAVFVQMLLHGLYMNAHI